ncbi:MAG: uracil-DNA glycosylase [Chloroflexi bacterium]|nr:uracil-DNA glycosylase [Chloroflexota bacterium]
MAELEELTQHIRSCTDCALSHGRTCAVPGEGPSNPGVMFIGEGPGFHEDQQGRPFVGPAGRFLEELLASADLRREQVYITNVVKCRPPNNRDPLPGEIEACRKHLERQVALLKPGVIVTLGRYSLAWFFRTETVSKAHGRVKSWNGTPLLALYHPAAALHQGALRQTLVEDFKRLAEMLAKAPEHPQEAPPSAKQLSMF